MKYNINPTPLILIIYKNNNLILSTHELSHPSLCRFLQFSFFLVPSIIMFLLLYQIVVIIYNNHYENSKMNRKSLMHI